MFHLNEAFYHEEMPARAKRLFVKTFKKYHKLDGGDEDVALHMAKQAVDREYVKLNNRWIPKTAAEEIVRHDLDEDSLSETEHQTLSTQQEQEHRNTTPFRRSYNKLKPRKIDFDEDEDEFLSESDRDDDDDSADGTDDDDDEDYTKPAYRARSKKLAFGSVKMPAGRIVKNKQTFK